MGESIELQDDNFLDDEWIISEDVNQDVENLATSTVISKEKRRRHARHICDRLMEERRLKKLIDEELGY